MQQFKEQIDDMRLKMAELEKRNNSMKAVIKSMLEGVIVVDNTTKILAVNNSAERLFGISKADAEEKVLLEVIRNSQVSDIAAGVLKSGNSARGEIMLTEPAGGIFMISASAIMDSGSIKGCVLVAHDITGLRRLEAVRRDFVANVSHELKTPLTSIKGFVDTLLDGALEDKQNSRKFLSIIAEHANRLDNLLNDLLSLSYLESKEVSLSKQVTNLKDLVDEVSACFKSQSGKKSITISNNIAADINIKIDKARMSQALTNLIDNAIKFNKQMGSVKIYSELAPGAVKVIFEDSGCGIPPKDLPRIFERFYRVDKARSRELGSTGLGLSIVKHIVELHSGAVGVESTEGAGSKFWFTLPA